MQEMWVWSVGQEDPLDKEMVTDSNILAWEIPGQRSLAGYSPWGCKESDTTEWLNKHVPGFQLFSSRALGSNSKGHLLAKGKFIVVFLLVKDNFWKSVFPSSQYNIFKTSLSFPRVLSLKIVSLVFIIPCSHLSSLKFLLRAWTESFPRQSLFPNLSLKSSEQKLKSIWKFQLI